MKEGKVRTKPCSKFALLFSTAVIYVSNGKYYNAIG